MKLYRVLLSIGILVSLATGSITPAHAADFAVGLFPPIMQIQATPPTVITKDITLVNASSDQEDLTIQLRLFTQSDNNNGQVQYPPDTVPRPDTSLFQKIQLLDNGNPVGGISLSPKQKKTLTLRIALPKGEMPADYYFSLLFLSTKSPVVAANGSTITAGIASNILLSIGPKTHPASGLLSEFSAPLFIQTGPVPFTVFVANTGDYFIAPSGHILVSNMFGQLVGQVDLLSTNILAHTSRYLLSKNGILQYHGHPAVMWGEKILFGLYQARITLTLSDQGPLFTKTIYFFAIPLDYLIGIFIVLIILSIVVTRVRMKTKDNVL